MVFFGLPRYSRAGTEEMKIWVTPEQREKLKSLARDINPKEPKVRYVLDVLFMLVETQPSVWKATVNRWKALYQYSRL